MSKKGYKDTPEMREFKKYLLDLLEYEQKVCINLLYISEAEKYLNIPQDLRIQIARLIRTPDVMNWQLRRLTKEELFKNPYLKNVKIPDMSNSWQLGDISIGCKRLMRGRIPTSCGCAVRDSQTLKLINHYCVLDEDIFAPSIGEGLSSTAWMTVDPFEIGTFKNIIEAAHGNVLLFGCGLAYVAYMIARKPNVTSVTVIEQNESVIKLCSSEIISQFPEEISGKIKIIKSDAMGYLSTCNLAEFDYVNVDVWYDTTDMIFTYLRCLPIEFENSTVQFSYWFEEQLKNELQRAIMAAFCGSKIDFFPCPLIKKIGEDIVKAKRPHIREKEDFMRIVNFSIGEMRRMIFEWYGSNIVVVDRYEADYKKTAELEAKLDANMVLNSQKTLALLKETQGNN